MKLNSDVNALIIFLKYPEPGTVKTRLGTKIGNNKAATIYSIIAKYIVKELINSDQYQTIIFYTPRKDKTKIENWLNSDQLKYYPQYGDSLGEKLANAFRKCFSNGIKNIVVIGTDCIDIKKREIVNVFKILAENSYEVVVGPSYDGGYYMLGTNTNTPLIFEGINWSTNKVLEETVEIMKKNNFKYIMMDKKNDIDELSDIDLNIIEKIDKSIANKISSILADNRKIRK